MLKTVVTGTLIAAVGLFAVGCQSTSETSYTGISSASNTAPPTYEQEINLSSSDALGYELFGVIELQPDRMAKLRQPRPLFGEDSPFSNSTEFADVDVFQGNPAEE